MLSPVNRGRCRMAILALALCIIAVVYLALAIARPEWFA
jgi:hypothetical protein